MRRRTDAAAPDGAVVIRPMLALLADAFAGIFRSQILGAVGALATAPLEPVTALVAAVPPLEPFGALGVLAAFAAGLMSRRSLILLVSALCSALFCAHFLRLGSATGAAMCVISLAQSLAATQGGRGARPAWFNGFFAASSAATLGLTLATWAGWSSALAGTGALFATAARLQGDAQRMRWLLLACTFCWVGHNTIVGSLFGLAGDGLTLVGLGAGLWRGRDARGGRLAPA